MGIWEEQALE